MSPSSSHCRGVVVAVVLLQCLCCRIVAVSSLPSPCRLHRHIVVVFVAISSLPLWCHLRRCIVMVLLLWFCCHCCGVAFAVASSSPRGVIELLKFSAKCDIMSS